MDDSVGTIFYIVILLIIVLAGSFSKKKKGREAQKTNVTEKRGTGSVVLDTLLKGAGIPTDVLQNEPVVRQEEIPVEETMDEFESPEEKITVEEVPAEEPFLEGDEGISAFQWDIEESIEEILKEKEDHYAIDYSTRVLHTLLKDFSGRKAIVYGEIMNRKYF